MLLSLSAAPQSAYLALVMVLGYFHRQRRLVGINVGQLAYHILFQLIFAHGSTLRITTDTHGGCAFHHMLYPFDPFLGLEDANIFQCSSGG